MSGLYYSQAIRRQTTSGAEGKPPKQVFKCGVKQIPHPEKAYKGGEDAYVMSDQLIAVADGVGGWNDVGVDPALFSRELCRNVWDQFTHQRNLGRLDVKEILVEAVKKTKSKGSSTFVMAGLDPDSQGIMKTINLGDSGFIIARPTGDRDLKLIYRSPDQLYGFDFPFQCGTNCDLPTDADTRVHVVKNKDLVILASDGIFDNVFDKDILKCL